MAEEMQEESIPEAGAKKPNKMIMIAGAAAGVLLLEAVGIFVAVKLVGKEPAETVAQELQQEQSEALVDHSKEATAEVLVAKLECPHTNTGRLYVISMTVYATVPKSMIKEESSNGEHSSEDSSDQQDIKKLIQENIATIKDRMRTVIASADTGTLCLARSEKPDYGLTTLRRQFKAILDDVLGKGIVRNVLISDYMPRPMD